MPRERVSLAVGTSRGLLLDLVRSHAPISRVELTERTGLTQATVSALVRGLIEDGLVTESGRGASTGGKPRTLLTLRARARYAVGLQLGAESNSFVAVDLAGAVAGRVRTAGVDGEPPQTAARTIGREVDDMLAGLGIAKSSVVGAGVAVPGPLDTERGMVMGSPQLASWVDVPVRDLLAEALDLPVLLDNDATAAALGDFWSGDLDDAHAHATIYMGSGLGCGLLINGSVMRGATSNSGELGQVVAALDASGARRTVQELAAPPAVVEQAARDATLRGRYRLDPADAVGGFVRIAAGAAQGDAAALALVERSAEHVALAVLNLATVVDLDSITLAGPAFAAAGDVYVRAIAELVDERFFARSRHRVRVRMSSQVSDAAAVGGAALVLQAFLAPRTMGHVPVQARASARTDARSDARTEG